MLLAFLFLSGMFIYLCEFGMDFDMFKIMFTICVKGLIFLLVIVMLYLCLW